MTAAQATMASIGDSGALDTELKSSLAEVWIDRDLSWLDFNHRVLAQALDDRTPLLERAKFLAIFTANLDEFFMKRVAVLRRRGSQPEHSQLFARIRERQICSLHRQAECFRKEIVPELARHGIYLRKWDE